MTMTRKDFIKIIKLRSWWKIDHRRGDYSLPNGSKLGEYVENLVTSQLSLDEYGIREDGNLAFYTESTGELHIPFKANEKTTAEEQRDRIEILIREIVWG